MWHLDSDTSNVVLNGEEKYLEFLELFFIKIKNWGNFYNHKEKQRGCPLLGANRYTHIYISYICVYILFICLRL